MSTDSAGSQRDTALVFQTGVDPQQARAAARQIIRELGLLENDTEDGRQAAREVMQSLGLLPYEATQWNRDQGRIKPGRKMVEGIL